MPRYSDFLPSMRIKETLALSPDGTMVSYIDDRLGQFNAVVQPLAGGEPRRLTSYLDTTVRAVAWHPDGRSLIFLADVKGDENTQLYQIDIDGAEAQAQALTNSTETQYEEAFGYPFSPDGRWLAFAGNDRCPDDQDVLIRDIATGEVRRVCAEGGMVFPGHWSPDGRWLTAIELRSAKSDHVVYMVPVDGGQVRRLTPEGSQAACWLGPWLPDGSGFLVMSDAGRDFTELAVMDAGTGRLSWLDTPGWDVEEVTLSGDGQRMVWTVNVDGASELRGRDLSTGADLPMPALPAGEVSGLTLTGDGRTAVMLLSTPTRPWNVAVLHLETGELRWLTDAQPVRVEVTSLVEPTLVHYPARDGRQIPAYLYYPRDRQGPVGVVLSVHGGPPSQERPNYSNDGFLQYLTSHGVAVLAPNVRGSSGYGMSYQRLSYRDWGGGDLEDLADAARYLHGQDWADHTRIGLVGRSYGGFAVLSCVARLPEFGWAAAVVWCGPSNLVTFTRAQPPTWRSRVAIMVGDPDADEDFLLLRSPVTYAAQIRTPLMVIQGANDPRVPKAESEQIVEQLRARGVEVRYDVFPDEGHTFGKRENQITARSNAGDFLLAHVLHDPSRAAEPAGEP
jgi:dipeptidyl aminopeptidase/acylaminoacyl peptidase